MTDNKSNEECDAPKEVEISVNSQQPISVESTKAEPVDSAVAKKAKKDTMDAAAIDLSTTVASDASASDLMDQIISLSEEELLPWEEVTLPSAGQYYDGKIPGGVVRVRPMGAKDDKILATQRLAQSGQALDRIFEHCVELPEGFDHLDLLAGDRMFLLYVLRGITHGNEYEFILTCPNEECGEKSTHTYDLNLLAHTIVGPTPGLEKEPFKVSLPYLSESLKRDIYVNLRLLRGRDVSAFASRKKFKKRITPGSSTGNKRPVELNQSVTDNIMLSMVSFMDDVHNESKLKQFIDRLHSRDIAVIREFLRDNTPGIDSTIDVTCPSCNTSFKTELPITEGFFRPARSPGSST